MKIRSFVHFSQLILFMIIFVFAHYYILENAIILSRDMLNADFSVNKMWPAPQYPIGRIPDTSKTRQYNAENHLALDFAQIYFPSQEFAELRRNYIKGDFDPIRRPSRYAPFVHFLCFITYCQLNYGPASLFHLFFQLFLFYFIFIKSFYLLKISRHIPLGILIVNICLFVTPAGISWFERGQFSLYVAMSYLMVVLWILKRKPLYIILGALFSFIKWTSFPTILIVFFVFVLVSENVDELRKKIIQLLPFFVSIIILLVLFPSEGFYFLQGLFQQELFATPRGISLVGIFPAVYVKFLPILLIGIGWLYGKRYRKKFEEYLPFFVGAGILMLMYPTKAYEYNVSTMFCFIPLVIFWAGLAKYSEWKLVRNLMACIFFLFLLSASYSRILVSFFETENIVYLLYLTVVAIFLIVPLVLRRFTLSSI